MKRALFIFLMLLPLILLAQTSSITGRVYDEQSGRPLSGANVTLTDLSLGGQTAEDGRFHFDKLSPGSYPVSISYIGYRTRLMRLQARANQTVHLEIPMEVSPLPMAEIVVTSTRYKLELKEAALPLEVVGSQRIAAQSPVTVADALCAEPGVSLQRDGIWGTSVSIRGLSRNSIVTLVDGNRIDTAADLAAGLSMVDVNQIARIEVIKGAAASLYGSGAMGGVVNIITRDGWYAEKPYFKSTTIASYASANNGGSGHLTLNAGGRLWYAQLSGLLRSADDMRTAKGDLANSQFRDDQVSGRVAFSLHPKHEIKLDYQRFSAYDVGIPGGYPLFPTQAKVSYPEERRELASLDYHAKNLSRFLPSVSIKLFSQNILRDVNNIPYQVSLTPATATSPAKRVSVLSIKPGATHNTLGVQLQSDWFLLKRHYLIAGIDGWQKDYRGYRTKETKIEVLDGTGSTIKTTMRTIGELPLPDSYYRSIGVFAQDEVSGWNNRLKWIIGGRFDRIEIQNDQGLNPLYEIIDGVRNDHPAGQMVNWPVSSDRSQSWSGNSGLLVHVTSTVDLTANLAQSFRAPSLEERFQYIDLGKTVRVGDPHLRPERGRFADLGLRIWRDPLQFSGNIFYNRLRDLVSEIPGTYEGRPALIKTNIGSAELYGGDLRFEWQPFSRHAITVSASYVRGEDLWAHTPLPQIAPLNGSIVLRSEPIRPITVQLVTTLFADQDRIATGETRTPGYAVFDIYCNTRPVQIGYLRTTLTAGVENILDRAYRNHLSTNRGLLNIEPGRNFIIKLRTEL